MSRSAGYAYAVFSGEPNQSEQGILDLLQKCFLQEGEKGKG
ncbi:MULTISPECIES: hypothetical protein [unclassified Nostoc]|nr:MULTISPECIES: hypothetical protein [unclassified Nostoc]MDM9582326.1 hypothetical protein [Nostoc sp. GT001]MDZ7944915.1 hypothetical protein [Nostoc sp. EfeVER01]MDZ7992563.1 hypothetical protein [Nostoc sp. EspVER01]